MSGIYIHIPFCKQACHYCDFHFSTNYKHRTALINAIIKELQLRKNELLHTTVATIYFGGGTPSVLTGTELYSIINAVYKNYNVAANPEITLEANPDDLISTSGDTSVFKTYKNIGVNRLSIGVQSFFDADLKLMNRAHNANEARVSIAEASRYFDNISIDLIYGIQGVTNAQWLQNIEMALRFNVPHISSYALTVEPKTALANFISKGILEDVNDQQAQEQFYILKDTLEANNFTHYELSNFGKQGYFSKNNTAYWQGKSYLGIGPSAHSFNGTQRGWNINKNSKYITEITNNTLPITYENLTLTDQYNEYVMTGLRTVWGVSLPKIGANFGNSYKKYILKQAQTFINQHLLYINNDHLHVTKKGQFLCDGIASELFKLNLQ